MTANEPRLAPELQVAEALNCGGQCFFAIVFQTPIHPAAQGSALAGVVIELPAAPR
ncbi:hypothetical protein AB0M46_23180 [Dactylosporangium sp. NPDC051485]|uniref:hypothetical protein n=1 Tax=Dactylosporangium sp. NPDC051485 TaxID=3154846 RepID=UPI0034210E4D